MWTETTEGRKYIEDISKRIVTESAPEELELFDELIAEYFADPSPPDLSDSGDDDALAFGIGEVLVAVTPVAAAMVTTVLTYILTEATEVIKIESAEMIKKRIKNIFSPEGKDKEEKEKDKEEKDKEGKDKEEKEKDKEEKDKEENDRTQPLTIDQLEQVKKLARRQAKKFGVEPAQANKMADALIGAIVLES